MNNRHRKKRAKKWFLWLIDGVDVKYIRLLNKGYGEPTLVYDDHKD